MDLNKLLIKELYQDQIMSDSLLSTFKFKFQPEQELFNLK